MGHQGDNDYISTVTAAAKIFLDIHSRRNLDMVHIMDALFGEVRAEVFCTCAPDS